MLVMDFIWIIAILALIYTILTRFIQFRFGGQNEMLKKNKLINKLNKEYLQATKRGDTVLAKKIQQEQMELMKGMWGSVINRLWVFIPILILFFLFTYTFTLPQVNGYLRDDIHIPSTLTASAYLGNNTVELCNYTLHTKNQSVWTAHVKGKIGNEDVEAFPHFLVNTENKELFQRASSGNKKGDISITTDKQIYKNGETVIVLAKSDKISGNPNGKLECVFDNGTAFYFDLGFTIPIIHVRYITSDYWMFIILSIIFSFGISAVYKGDFTFPKNPDNHNNNNKDDDKDDNKSKDNNDDNMKKNI